MREKESKKRPFAGIMLVLLYFSRKAKALIFIGGVLVVIGFIGGSILVP